MAQATRDVEQLISDYQDLRNGDFSKLDVVAESATIRDPAAPEGEVQGRDALEAYLREFRSGFPDLRITIDDTLAGDEAVTAEWTATGTHEGEFNGIAPTEREIGIAGMDNIQVAGGRVQEHWVYYDLRELFEQLGLTER
jgi:steroid delta-isomerase-like uncharacterized protein